MTQRAYEPPSKTASWIGLYALPAVGAMAFLFLAHNQLSTVAMGNHIDEYYYSACAVRGLHIGAIPVPSCHDNKGPLTYLVYEIIFALAGDYNFVAVKLISYLLAAADVAILAWVAFRLAGSIAASVTIALLLSCLSADVANLSLRTETVGGPFLSLALLVLCRPQSFRHYGSLLLGGLAIGMAVLAKQTYAFAGFAIIFWIFLCEPVCSLVSARRFLVRSLIFGLSVLAPFLLFCLLFWSRGDFADYLASFFLYPAVYGGDGAYAIGNVVRHTLTLWAHLTDLPVLAGAAFGAIMVMVLSLGQQDAPRRFSDPRWLVTLVLLFLLAVLGTLPKFFPPHVLLAVWPMALLSGVIFGDCWPRIQREMPRMALVLVTVLLFGITIFAAQTWQSNGKEELSSIPDRKMPVEKADTRARYAYQLGTQADFYAKGGFIPASTVQFAWALPGTPEEWSYIRPRAGTLTRQWLDREQARNLAQLYRDFAQTPPSYILFDDDYVRGSRSRNISDIPGFDAYLAQHCRLSATSRPRLSVQTFLYDCRTR